MARNIQIAEHLWELLETMATDMGTDSASLVNQAIFNWARVNGYSVQGRGQTEERPEPAAKATAPAPRPARPDPTPEPPPPDPFAEPDAEADDDDDWGTEPDTPSKSSIELPPRTIDYPVDATVPEMDMPNRMAEREVEASRPEPESEPEPEPAPQAEPVDDADEYTGPPDEHPARVAQAERIAAIAADVERLTTPIPDEEPEPEPVELPEQEVAPAARDTTTREPTITPAPAGASITAAPTAPDDDIISLDESDDAVLIPAPQPLAEASTDARGARPKVESVDDLLESIDALGVTGRGGYDEELDDATTVDVPPNEKGRETEVVPVPNLALRPRLQLKLEGAEPIHVDADPFVIGRSVKCDLVIDSARASRAHANVIREGNSFVLEDRGSSNGTWYAGKRIDRQEIKDGDVFIIGDTNIAFSIAFPKKT